MMTPKTNGLSYPTSHGIGHKKLCGTFEAQSIAAPRRRQYEGILKIRRIVGLMRQLRY